MPTMTTCKSEICDAADLDRLLVDRRDRPVLGPEGDHHGFLHDDGKPDGDQQRRHVPHRAHWAEGDLLGQDPEDPARDHGQDEGHRPGEPPDAHHEVAHEGPEHVHLTVGEGDEVHGAEDDDETDGHQGVETPLGEAVHDLL